MTTAPFLSWVAAHPDGEWAVRCTECAGWWCRPDGRIHTFPTQLAADVAHGHHDRREHRRVAA